MSLKFPQAKEDPPPISTKLIRGTFSQTIKRLSVLKFDDFKKLSVLRQSLSF